MTYKKSETLVQQQVHRLLIKLKENCNPVLIVHFPEYQNLRTDNTKLKNEIANLRCNHVKSLKDNIEYKLKLGAILNFANNKKKVGNFVVEMKKSGGVDITISDLDKLIKHYQPQGEK